MFYGISNFKGYVIPKVSFCENNIYTVQLFQGEVKGVIFFPGLLVLTWS